ncbi:uncharacterized protein SCHCODRAFT_02597228 [Schizophyllum commune H4-8]|uniref:Uncharacterized protein n=1 Tax=Schizophyllum commune (strain H4-8 / FGSC 9210) TaxID=578458 RepID=D8PYF5_SCHCM|nr:uncharacterized protein SCHCODRAFT_02597228 [Schizophyllum commune H4-8]KAI5895932.1 hypothetical protein SCHCODRAFT_02597228 [Schizophyllum commune H4-8]
MKGRAQLFKEIPARALKERRTTQQESAQPRAEEVPESDSDDGSMEYQPSAKRPHKSAPLPSKRRRGDFNKTISSPSMEGSAGPSTHQAVQSGVDDQNVANSRFLQIMQNIPEKAVASVDDSLPAAWKDVPDVGQTDEGSESLRLAAMRHKAFMLARRASVQGE